MTRSSYVTQTFLLLILLATATFAQPYQFPFLGDDLAPGERLFAADHAVTVAQAEAEDIVMFAYENDQWYEKTGNLNEDHVIYGQPVHAMEDGIVVGCWRNTEENVNPPALHPNFVTGQKLVNGNWRNTGLIPGGGNMLFIDQIDGNRALYAHFTPGSIPAELCPNNDVFFPFEMTIAEGDAFVMLPPAQQVPVVKGQFLGEVGNSGSSSKPHLHVHTEQAGVGVPMIFEAGLSKRYTGVNTPIQGDWTSFAGQEVPDGQVLIRPERMFQYRMADYESFNNDGTQVYVGIFEPGTYPPAAYFSADWNDFLSTWSNFEGQGYRMKDLEATQENGTLIYSGIFEPGTHKPMALFRSNWNDFLSGWSAIEARGYRMKDFEAYQVGGGAAGGTTMYAGIFEPGTHGPMALFRTDWNSFVNGWGAIEAMGYRMKDFEAYEDGGQLTYAGIFEPGNHNPMALFDTDWNSFLAGWGAIEDQGYRMIDVEIFEDDGVLTYSGIFEPNNYVPAAAFVPDWDDFLEVWQSLE